MSYKKYSIYDISFDYIKTFYKADIPKETKKQIILDIAYILESGWTAPEIYKHINSFKSSNPNDVMNIKKYFLSNKIEKINLISTKKFYFHNELRITTSPPIVICDYNTGLFTKKVEDYFLEMNSTYTIDDLYEYYLTKYNLYEKNTLNYKRIIGGLGWLLKNHDLDILLFMIDIADNVIESNRYPKLKNPMEVNNYYLEAKSIWESKLTESKSMGDDTLVLRKRVLFH